MLKPFARSFLGACLCLAFLPAAYAPAAVALSAEAEYFGKVIRSIQYDADRPLVREHYDRCIGLKPGDILTRTGLKAAIQGLYDTGSFSEIAADATPEGDGVRLLFRLRLCIYFNLFHIQGDVDLGGRLPSEAMALPTGERFSNEMLEAARKAVLQYVQDQGYYQAEVTARPEFEPDGPRVDTTFEVRAGRRAVVRELEIRGVPGNEGTILREKLGVRVENEYDRERLLRRMESLKLYYTDRGFLDVELTLGESYRVEDNSIALEVAVANFGQVLVEVEGFKIPKDTLRRLLPALSGEGLSPELLSEGTANLHRHLEENGYPEAEVTLEESRNSAGVRMLRYIIDRGRKVTVQEVRFRGNEAFADAELARTIRIRPSQFLRDSAYSVSLLDADVESLLRLYRSSGYLNAVAVPLIELLQDEGWQLRITFEFEEGIRASTESVAILGGRSLAMEALKARMRLKPGGFYSPAAAEHDRQVIIAAYNDAGFLQPAVSYRAEASGDGQSYAVEFQIEEGVQTYIEKIIVVGKEETRDWVIERRILMKPGEPLSLGGMLETQQSLYKTGVFDMVRVGPQNADSSSIFQNVIVRLQEARPVTVRYGIGYQEREKLRGILELSHLNLFGLGQRADLRLRGSAIEQAGILSFQQPQVSFLPVGSYLTISGGKRREISFDTRRLDLSYQYSRPVNDHTWGLLRYRFTNVSVSDVTPDLAREETPRNLSTVSAVYINDTRDNYLDPTEGFFTSSDVSFTMKLPRRNLASGHYLSLYTQNSYFRKLMGNLGIASSFRFGLIYPFAGDRDVPISERFFAGGGSSLRGFETDRAGPLGLNGEPIGGNALLIGNLEVLVPLVSRFELVGFYDVGNVYRSLSAIRVSEFSHAVGLGLRIKTPFGPLRVDYGYNLNLSPQLGAIGYKRGHLFVNIGPPF